MARGFGSTKGSGTTDSVELPYSTHGALRSYAFFSYRNGAGGGSWGHMLSKSVAGSSVEDISFQTPVYWYMRSWTLQGQFYINPAPSASAWHHIAVTYNSGSISNKPLMYVDGVSKSVVTNQTPSGSLVNNNNNYVLGNRKVDNARVWDGMLAEFGMWGRILTATEIAALAAGWSPLAFRGSLVSYVPLVGDTVDRLNGAATVVGTAVQPHIGVIHPASRVSRRYASAAAPAGSVSHLGEGVAVAMAEPGLGVSVLVSDGR